MRSEPVSRFRGIELRERPRLFTRVCHFIPLPSRMIKKKFEAGWALRAKALSGARGLTAYGATAAALAHSRRMVRANQR
jgi:hypothetical protein